VAELSGQQIREPAKQIVRESPGGIRHAGIVERILEVHPEISKNTIRRSIWNLHMPYPHLIQKPSRGVFVWVGDAGEPPPSVPQVKPPKEEEFYAPVW